MNTSPVVLPYQTTKISIPWSWRNVGDGEIIIEIKNRGQEIEIWNENLSREEVKKILFAFVDKVMTQGKMMEYRKD